MAFILGFGSGLRLRLRIERASVLGLILTVLDATTAATADATAGTAALAIPVLGDVAWAPEPGAAVAGATNGVSDLPNLISSPGAATSSLQLQFRPTLTVSENKKKEGEKGGIYPHLPRALVTCRGGTARGRR